MEGQRQIINEDKRLRKHERDNNMFSSYLIQPYA
jgi:hypothetical protein